MPPRRLSTLSYFLIFALAGILVGCGGGSQPEGDSQDAGGSDGTKKQAGGATPDGAKERKIALGEVRSVDSDGSKIVLKTRQEIEGGGRITFRVAKNANITLDEKEAELGDAKRGQQAQIEYVAHEKVNRAVTVRLFAAEGEPSGG